MSHEKSRKSSTKVEEKKNRLSWKIEIVKAIVLLCFFAVIAVVVVNNRDMLTIENARVVLSYIDFKKTNEEKLADQKMYFIGNTQNQYAAYKNQFCVISSDGLRIFKAHSREESFFAMPNEAPILLSGDRFLLAYDFGKNYVNIFNSTGLVKNMIFDYPVYCASLSDSGYFALSVGARGYKGSVVVYDRNMRKIFEWFSSEGYIGDVSISQSNNELCAVSILTQKGGVSSNLSLYRFDSETPVKVVNVADDMVVDVAYKDPNLIVAMSDKKLLLLDGKGEEKGTYTYPEGHLQAYSLEAKRYNVFAMAQNVLGENITVYVVDNNGSEVTHFGIAGSIKDMQVNDKGITILTSSQLMRMDFNGQLTEEKNVFSDAQKIVLCDNGVYLVSIGTAEYIQLG